MECTRATTTVRSTVDQQAWNREASTCTKLAYQHQPQEPPTWNNTPHSAIMQVIGLFAVQFHWWEFYYLFSAEVQRNKFQSLNNQDFVKILISQSILGLMTDMRCLSYHQGWDLSTNALKTVTKYKLWLVYRIQDKDPSPTMVQKQR